MNAKLGWRAKSYHTPYVTYPLAQPSRPAPRGPGLPIHHRKAMPSTPSSLLLLPLALLLVVGRPARAFSPSHFPMRSSRVPGRPTSPFHAAESGAGFGKEGDEAGTKKKTKKKGDSIRDATGIRPSLHPVAINCVAEALLMRSKQILGKAGSDVSIDVANADAEPIEIAVTAAGVAMAAIDQRAEAAKTDETTDAFTTEESQAISGRVVGVVMRARELELTLATRVNAAKWPLKYFEEASFGVSRGECKSVEDGDDPSKDGELEKALAEKMVLDPLFRMSRAECLLALFIDSVERPKLEMVGESVPGGSNVDFVDADRLEVLLTASFG